LLSQAYGIMPFYTAAFSNGAVGELRRIVEQLVQKADAAAQKAVRLDPGDADGYVALGAVRQFQGRFAEAEDLYRRALSLDRGNPDALHRMSLALATVGRVRESVPLRLQLRAQEPLVPTFNVATGGVLWASGQTGQAIATLQPLPVSAFSGVFLAQAYASADRFGEAAETLRRIPEGVFPPAVISEAVRVLTDAPKTSPPVKSLSSGLLGFVYAYAGAPDRILDFYEGLAEARYPEAGDIPYLLWAPAYSQTRKTERFRAYARKAGLVDYWRARGWPDLCHPTTGDDFVCS